MTSQTQEELQRKMLHRVGVVSGKFPFHHEENMQRLMLDWVSHWARASQEEANPLLKRIEYLEKEVHALTRERQIKKVPSKADLIYLKFKDELENEHFGKIIAIDADSEKIVGIGNSILEAYSEAIKKSSKKQFTFRRVGSDFVHKL